MVPMTTKGGNPAQHINEQKNLVCQDSRPRGAQAPRVSTICSLVHCMSANALTTKTGFDPAARHRISFVSDSAGRASGAVPEGRRTLANQNACRAKHALPERNQGRLTVLSQPWPRRWPPWPPTSTNWKEPPSNACASMAGERWLGGCWLKPTLWTLSFKPFTWCSPEIEIRGRDARRGGATCEA